MVDRPIPGRRAAGASCLRLLVRSTAIAATLLVGTASAAADYATRTIGSWVVSASSDREGCFLTRSFSGPGGTTLLFGMDVDGSNRLTILNANWSIRERERLRLNFRLSGSAFPDHPVVGIAAEGKKGFVTSFGPAFAAGLAASRQLHVRRGAVPVAELDLTGSGAAIAELRKCVAGYRDTPVARDGERRKKDRIPVDPFASDPRRESRRAN